MNFQKLKDKFDIAPLLGFALGGLCVISVLLGDGRKFSAFLSLDAFAVVVGGSLGASLMALHSKDLRSIMNVIPSLLGWVEDPSPKIVESFKVMLTTLRRSGPLMLENYLDELEHPTLKNSIQQMVDGTEIAVIHQFIEFEKERESSSGVTASSFFESLGGFAPTFGIVGTVISLVSVLSHLDDPALLAQGVAEAFIATFYGVLFANLVFLPLAMRVSRLTLQKIETLDLIATGMESLSKEENPILMTERLKLFLPESHR